MSRGLGKAQRFVLDELAKSTEGWPPWITVEALAARYAGAGYGETVAYQDERAIWRAGSTPGDLDSLIGLSVESATQANSAQHLARACVESIRRATKALAQSGRLDILHIEVVGRGATHTVTGRDDYGNRWSWQKRVRVPMLAARRLLTPDEEVVAAERRAAQRARAEAAFAYFRRSAA